MILKTITKTKIFFLSLVSGVAALFLAIFIFDNRVYKMYFWTPLLVYFLIQCFVLYLSIKTKIKHTWIIALINVVIVFFLCLSLTFFLFICTAIGAMRG